MTMAAKNKVVRLYLDEKSYEWLTKQSKRTSWSVSQVVQRILKRVIPLIKREQRARKPSRRPK